MVLEAKIQLILDNPVGFIRMNEEILDNLKAIIGGLSFICYVMRKSMCYASNTTSYFFSISLTSPSYLNSI